MRRRRFLLALGAAVPLAGCSSQDGEPSPPPTDEPPETTTETGPPSGDGYLQYLLTAEELGEDWTRSFQGTVTRYAERELENTADGRRLGLGVRISETEADAEESLGTFLSNFQGGSEIDADLGDETYEAYPADFDTGVLFRDGTNIGFAALAAGEEGTTTTANGTTANTTTTADEATGTTTSSAGTDAGVTVEDALEYATQLHEKLPASP